MTAKRGQAALQKLIKRESEHIKPGIGPEERIGQPKGSAITKAEIRVPLRIEDGRIEQSDDGSPCSHSQVQNRGRDLDAEFRGKRRFARQTTDAERGRRSSPQSED